MIFNVIGYIAMGFSTIGGFFQMVKTLRDKKLENVNYWPFLMMSTAMFLWSIYALEFSMYPSGLTSLVTGLTLFATSFKIIRVKHSNLTLLAIPFLSFSALLGFFIYVLVTGYRMPESILIFVSTLSIILIGIAAFTLVTLTWKNRIAGYISWGWIAFGAISEALWFAYWIHNLTNGVGHIGTMITITTICGIVTFNYCALGVLKRLFEIKHPELKHNNIK